MKSFCFRTSATETNPAIITNAPSVSLTDQTTLPTRSKVLTQFKNLFNINKSCPTTISKNDEERLLANSQEKMPRSTQTRDYFSTLPVELIEKVVGYSSTREVAQLAQTNSTIRSVLQKKLDEKKAVLQPLKKIVAKQITEKTNSIKSLNMAFDEGKAVPFMQKKFHEWESTFYKIVSESWQTRGQLSTVVQILEKPCSERNVNDLRNAGLLKGSLVDTFSESKKRYLLSNQAILEMVKKSPNLLSYSQIPDEYIPKDPFSELGDSYYEIICKIYIHSTNMAIKNNNEAILENILKSQLFNITGEDPSRLQELPLSYAVSVGSLPMVKMLIQAAPQTVDNLNWEMLSPLYTALFVNQNFPIAQALIDAGANIKTSNGKASGSKNLLDIAEQHKNTAVILFLKNQRENNSLQSVTTT